jgi:hypothetical protein
MLVDTRIAALIFVVPFTLAVCIVAVESDPADRDARIGFTGFLVLTRKFARPEDSHDC